MTFDVTDTATWPVLLDADQVGAIYARPAGGIKKACQRNNFIPAPKSIRPYRWRRADVVRDVEGARVVFRRSA